VASGARPVGHSAGELAARHPQTGGAWGDLRLVGSVELQIILSAESSVGRAVSFDSWRDRARDRIHVGMPVAPHRWLVSAQRIHSLPKAFLDGAARACPRRRQGIGIEWGRPDDKVVAIAPRGDVVGPALPRDIFRAPCLQHRVSRADGLDAS
jgi:hypothetical protein